MRQSECQKISGHTLSARWRKIFHLFLFFPHPFGLIFILLSYRRKKGRNNEWIFPSSSWPISYGGRPGVSCAPRSGRFFRLALPYSQLFLSALRDPHSTTFSKQYYVLQTKPAAALRAVSFFHSSQNFMIYTHRTAPHRTARYKYARLCESDLDYVIFIGAPRSSLIFQ